MKLAWIGISLWVLLALWGLWAVKHTSSFPKIEPQPLIKINGSTLYGYDKDKLMLSMTFESIEAPFSTYNFVAKGGTNGILYDNDKKPFITQLTANDILIRFLSQDITISGHVKGEIPSSRGLSFQARNLTFFGRTKEAVIQNGLDVFKKEFTLSTNKKTAINFNRKELVIDGESTIHTTTFNITAKHFKTDMEKDVSELSNTIRFIKKGFPNLMSKDSREKLWLNQTFSLTCDHLTYQNSTQNMVAKASGNLHLSGNNSDLYANEGLYYPNQKLFHFKGPVKLHTQHLYWMFSKTFQSPKQSEIQLALHTPTDIQCNELIFDRTNKILMLKGNVKISQKNMTLTCNDIRYDDEKKEIHFNGQVRLERKDKGKLQCEQAVFNVQNETITVEKNITTEFRLKLQQK